MKVNLPGRERVLVQDSFVKLALFVVGGTQPDLACAERKLEGGRYVGDGFHTEIAGLLADGSDIPVPRTMTVLSPEAGDVVVTVQFNAPGRGDATCTVGGASADEEASAHSDGDPAFMGAESTPGNQTGDDFNGEMTYAAVTAVVEAAEAIVRAAYGADVDIRKVVCSHSNGAVLASRLAAERTDIHAFIDAEGPTDSLEQTVSTECFDFFGTYVRKPGCPWSLPQELSLDVWMSCRGLRGGREETGLLGRCGGHTTNGEPFFELAWEYFFRPPEDVLAEATSGLGNPFIDDTGQPFDWATVLDGEVAAFWGARRPLTYHAQRRTPYVRINCKYDHAQPEHYRNRHATRALLAAASSTSAYPSDVYRLKTVDPGTPLEPVRFSPAGVDADTLDGLLEWPDTCGYRYERGVWDNPIDAPLLEGAVVRWAFEQEFGYTDLASCVRQCAESRYCDDTDARMDCVEACVATEAQVNGVVEDVAYWFGYASFRCDSLYAAVEACGEAWCDDLANRTSCIEGALRDFGLLTEVFRALAESEYPTYFTEAHLPECFPLSACYLACTQDWCGEKWTLLDCYQDCIDDACSTAAPPALCQEVRQAAVRRDGWEDGPDTIPCPATWRGCANACDDDADCVAWCTRMYVLPDLSPAYV